MFADLSIPYQVWVLVGLAFLVADLATPGLILSCFGLGCLAGSAAAFLAPSATLAFQGGAALTGTLFSFLVIRPPLRRTQKRRKERRAEASKPPKRRDKPPYSGCGLTDLFASRPELDEPMELREQNKPKTAPTIPNNIANQDSFAPKPPKWPSTMLNMFEEQASPLLLTDTVEDPPRQKPELWNIDMNLSLASTARLFTPVGRTAIVLTAMGPFTSGLVDLDGAHYKAFSDHHIRPGEKVAVLEQFPDYPKILVVEPHKGGL